MSPDPANVPISAAGHCLPWEPLVYALDRIVDLGPIHGPGRAAAEARYGRVAAVLAAYPDLADEVERLRLIETGARDSEALVAHLRAERDAERARAEAPRRSPTNRRRNREGGIMRILFWLMVWVATLCSATINVQYEDGTNINLKGWL